MSYQLTVKERNKLFEIEIDTRQINKVLSYVLRFFSVNTFCCVDMDEIIHSNKQVELSDLIKLTDFQSFLDDNENYFIQARVFLYNNCENAVPVNNWEEFNNCGCLGVILITDACLIEVCCKDKLLSQKLYQNICKIIPFNQVKLHETKRSDFRIF